MTIVLGVVLAVLGLALWVFAGLLPVARILRGDTGTVSVALVTTWMGSVTLSGRRIDNVSGARIAQTADAPRRSKVELKVNGEWHKPIIRFTQDETAIAQFVGVLQQYLKVGGPRVLALPLRGRLNMMKRFLAFFPLGTASLFTGILFITGMAG